MLRRIFFIFLTCVISIGGGAWSVNAILQHFHGFGRLKIGEWEAFPQSGTRQADIYARARSIKFETIALGQAEGLVFMRWHDEEGRKLRPNCRYQLAGRMPEASFFTLYAVDLDLKPRQVPAGLPGIINSDNALRQETGAYHIVIAPQAQGGNWLAIDPTNGEEDAYGLVLTLYDTPIITTTGMSDLDMPHLARLSGDDCL